MVETRLDAGCPNAQSQPQIPGRVRHFPSPPFINIDGLHNFRDCGGYPIADCPDKIIRQGVLYRSADPSRITTKGISQLGELKVSRIFDLRSDSEIEDSTKKGWGQIRVWDQVVRVPATVFTDDDIAKEQRARRDHNLRSKSIEVYGAEFTASVWSSYLRLGTNFIQGFVKCYQDVLDSASSASNPFQPLKNILSHLATPGTLKPILIHCSLGKDRTGVFCALILNICGVSDNIVAHEYALTALGIEDKIASIITEIWPNGPGISEEEERFFSSRLVLNNGHL